MSVNKNNIKGISNIEKVTRLSNVQKKIDDFFFEKDFLKINNEINKKEQNIRLNPKKNQKRTSKQNRDQKSNLR